MTTAAWPSSWRRTPPCALQVVDACVIALAERLDVREVAALDRRDFLVVAPRHLPKGERLTLLPAD